MAESGYLNHLYNVVLSRKDADKSESYVAKLFSKGRLKIAQKVGEEGVELALAAVGEGKKEIIGESADLIFHMLVLWAKVGVTPDDVMREMQIREGKSGLMEKAARKKERDEKDER